MMTSSDSHTFITYYLQIFDQRQHAKGILTGVLLVDSPESKYGDCNVWVQGVEAPYDADLNSNTLLGGTSQAAIGEAIRLFNEASAKCPNTPVVTGGYRYCLLLGPTLNLHTTSH